MRCKVNLTGSKDAQPVVCHGEYEYSGGAFELKYDIYGDSCLLTYRGGRITQSRRGEVNTDITFKQGAKTVCMLLSGELTGSVPVETLNLAVSASSGGADVRIDYYLGGALINLRLFVTSEDIQ